MGFKYSTSYKAIAGFEYQTFSVRTRAIFFPDGGGSDPGGASHESGGTKLSKLWKTLKAILNFIRKVCVIEEVFFCPGRRNL